MFYRIALSDYPSVSKIYTVTRNTVWQISEKEHLLIIIRRGECTISCAGETHILKAGDIFYIPADVSYVRRPVDGKVCTMVYIHFTTKSPVYQEDIYQLTKNISAAQDAYDSRILTSENSHEDSFTVYLESKNTPRDTDPFYRCVAGIISSSSGRRFTGEFKCSVYLCEILAILSEETAQKLIEHKRMNPGRPVPANLKKAVEYISSHYSEKITLEELASHCAVSKQQLIRYFKDSLNTTPLNYITEYRLSRAKELLFNCPQLTVKEIAVQLGFDNQHYFSRVFVKVCGETPSQFRYRTVNYDKLSKKSSKKP
ncbi:MAG: helix-turn-helix transcriptional regulator [Clostridia bacterium]|nr:helix-turn-helix transcriptional regulator [Clostridia bacterium]